MMVDAGIGHLISGLSSLEVGRRDFKAVDLARLIPANCFSGLQHRTTTQHHHHASTIIQPCCPPECFLRDRFGKVRRSPLFLFDVWHMLTIPRAKYCAVRAITSHPAKLLLTIRTACQLFEHPRARKPHLSRLRPVPPLSYPILSGWYFRCTMGRFTTMWK